MEDINGENTTKCNKETIANQRANTTKEDTKASKQPQETKGADNIASKSKLQHRLNLTVWKNLVSKYQV